MQQKKDSFAALRFKDFRLYLGMRFFFEFASQMQIVVIGFYVYQITRSAFALGMLGLCGAIPAIGMALYGGYIADKSEKRKMLLIVHAILLLSSLVIFSATLNGVSGIISASWIVPIIYSMIFCNGVARAFYDPASFTVYAHSIPKELYPKAGALSASGWQIAAILGPALGGLLYGFSGRISPGLSGMTATFGCIMLLVFISLMCVYFMKPRLPIFEPKEKIGKSMSEGIRFVFKSKMMLGAMSLDLFSVFFGGAAALLPVFATEILKVGAGGLGIMRATMSAGAVLVMLAMSGLSPMGRPWRNLLIAVSGFGLAIICFALSHNFYLSLFFLFLQGAFDSVSVLIRSTIMQLLVPDQMRGRVSAINSMFISSSSEIGDFESGTVAGLMGTIPAVIFGGCMTLGVVMVTFLKTKKMVPLSLNEIHPLENIKAEKAAIEQ